ncbi:olfactory receptor 140-like [Thalassophryne amazonica]|uniref:olfactory receptor 140-like n=1 Tax=Thalassophryne amazonica TaxID=390379 RepID=UPI0014725F7A|nr:olfactory receptor 140-like [Thalassophryne amazonica]
MTLSTMVVSNGFFFSLSGLNFTAEHKLVLFAVTSLYYVIIWFVNVALILTIVTDRTLHDPMYVFLCSMCVSGLYGTSGFYPKFLKDLLSPAHVASYTECFLQSFVIYSSYSCDLSTLTLMAFDRYVAICLPLRYHSVMTKQRVALFVVFSWLLPLFCMFVNTMTVLQSDLCGSNIPKLYCSNYFINKLACTPSVANTGVVYFNIIFYILHFVFILCSYIPLLRTCQRSNEGWNKFVQTCVPHLIALLNFGVAVLFDLMYMRFGSLSLTQNLQNFMSIEVFLIPPIMNPLIYGLKLSKLRNKVHEFIHKN